MNRLAMLLVLLVTGCSTVTLYENPGKITIHLLDDPKVTESSYKISFRFEHSDKDSTHLIQKLEWNWKSGAGLESFRTINGKMHAFQRDTHSMKSGGYELRTMTLMTGKVEGADETYAGFAMLPSDWPKRFNKRYIKDHEIRGNIVNVNPETATKYTLEFDHGKLTFSVNDKKVNIKYVWYAASTDGKPEG